MQLFHNEPGEGDKRRFVDVTAGRGPGLTTSRRRPADWLVGDVDRMATPTCSSAPTMGLAALPEKPGSAQRALAR